MSNGFTRFLSHYKTAAVVFLNVVVFFVVLNLLAALALAGRDYLKAHGGDLVPNNPWSERAKVYPGMSQEDIYDLYMETWNRPPYQYDTLAQFREAPFSGRFVNVTEHGYRKGRRDNPWPPSAEAFNIFVFGGSTTFGFGVPDWDTVPSFIEEIAGQGGRNNIAVYNFGRGYFYSTHEVLLFQRLLMDGHVPDAAVFIDGLNDFYYHRQDFIWTERLRKLVGEQARLEGNPWYALADSLPISELVRFLLRYLGTTPETLQRQSDENLSRIAEGGNQANADYVIERYLRNMSLARVLADAYGVTPVFVWQPVPTYKYAREKHLFGYRDLGAHVTTGAGYEAANARLNDGSSGRDFVWCADIQQGVDKPLYVDNVHYNAELSRMLAACIVEGSGLAERAASQDDKGGG